MELKEYINIMRKKMWLIIAIVIVVCTFAAVKSVYYTEPIYQADAELIVNQANEFEGTKLLDYSTIQTNIMVINSYMGIIKSSAVMEKVVTRYPDLDVTVKELASNVVVSTTNESQIMNLSYQDPSYEVAAKTVNAIAAVFKEQVPKIMKVDNVTLLSSAKLTDEVFPVNINPVISIMIGFIMSLMLAIGLVFLLDYLDDTFKNEAEVLKELNLPTLAMITTIRKDDTKANKKSKSQSQTQVGEGNYATLNQ
ncbi:YveK family protein [Paenibacillus sp. IHBB 10380]|uniref:YveK family protein n=1 Tax=Paenibacillus sp. IHBB 10380 TaxID=1566358 RepID=UPI0005CFADF8|nr:Wzz/FepE/Etk N-terminal domain-containing protein [Paenibacillus sp. IHBB 10380]AJS60046.1 lipopolysaccharide biosynthesis protein [Paenibacillus sp. IHBB 10380]